jgi:hypothetical protein
MSHPAHAVVVAQCQPQPLLSGIYRVRNETDVAHPTRLGDIDSLLNNLFPQLLF